jgi:hypothetical protein
MEKARVCRETRAPPTKFVRTRRANPERRARLADKWTRLWKRATFSQIFKPSFRLAASSAKDFSRAALVLSMGKGQG